MYRKEKQSRAQSDCKLMQITKVKEEGLGRGSEKVGLFLFPSLCARVPRGSRLRRSLDPSRATELRKRKRLLAV